GKGLEGEVHAAVEDPHPLLGSVRAGHMPAHTSAAPRKQTVVAPPTQTSSSSAELETTPDRPSAVPCVSVKECGAQPAPLSHCATEALRLPVTGSSGIPAPGAKARISYSCSDPSGWAPRTPILASGTEEKSGSSPSTCSALRRRRAAQPGPLSTH